MNKFIAWLKRSENFKIFVIGIGASLSLINSLNKDIFWILIIIIGIVLLLFLAQIQKNKRRKLLYYTILLFCLLHLIIFPFIYSYLLKKDSKSILVSTDVYIMKRIMR